MTYNRALILLMLGALACIVCFMTIGLRGNLTFVITLRAIKLLALVEVGIAIAVSTIIFQTVTANHILTPSIMGIDALYIFGQILLVFLFGGAAYASLNDSWKFMGEIALLMTLTCCLMLPLLKARWDMGLVLLSGIIIGVLFRSLHSLLARLIDPNDFAVVQAASFVNFNNIETKLLAVATVLTISVLFWSWRMRHTLDVVALGRNAAIGLGVDWKRMQLTLLLVVAALVSVSTALVGPVAFLGLLFVALAERIVGTRRHSLLIPAAALVAIIVLVGGQTFFQHALGNSGTLGIVIEFVGGSVFLILLWRGSRR